MKYLITIEQRKYGNIEVEASNREKAKAKALQLAEANEDNIDWFKAKSQQVVEVYKIEEGIKKPKFTLSELKQKRNELARLCMSLQDALYEDCDNKELRYEYEDAEDEYAYVNKLIERREKQTI